LVDLKNSYLTSLKELWNSCESLHFNRIRMKVLPLMLAMPLAIMVADMQYSFLGLQAGLFGIDSSTVLQVMYSIGAISVFLLGTRHIFSFMRVSMAVTAVSFILYFILPPGMPKILSTATGYLGLGGCAIIATLFYCASLQNTERLYSAMLLAVLSPVFILVKSAGIMSPVIGILIPVVFIAAMLYCLYNVKRKDLEQLQTPCRELHNGSIACGLTYIVCYFLLYIFNTRCS
jgi:small-conductance mechanosensitive channel